MTSAKTFEETKKDIISRCKERRACQSEFERILAAETKEEILQVLKDNISWCMNFELFTPEYLEEWYGVEALHKMNMYTSGEHNISVDKTAVIVLLRSSSATVETFGSSSATVKTFGSSSATVKTLGSSSATVETWHTSSANVETLDSSSATLQTVGSKSKLTYQLGDGACPAIKHLNEQKLFVKTLEFEIVQIS
jgi:hypothetical protein